MKKTWNTPELHDLTISATANTDMLGCGEKPNKPNKPVCPNFPINPPRPPKPGKPSENPIPENPTEELS